jgi:hypothetical protein
METYTFFNGNPISNWMPFMTKRKTTVDREGELETESQDDGVQTATMIKIDKDTHSKTWGILDDVIMGGNSMSKSEVQTDDSDHLQYVVFTGETNLKNGGFCSVRTLNFDPAFDVSSFHGLCFKARSKQNFIYKLYLRDTTHWNALQW